MTFANRLTATKAEAKKLPLTGDELIAYFEDNKMSLDCNLQYQDVMRAGYNNLSSFAEALYEARQRYRKPIEVKRQNIIHALLQEHFQCCHEEWDTDDWDKEMEKEEKRLNSATDDALFIEVADSIQTSMWDSVQEFLEAYC